MRYLITGATGMIGGLLVRTLLERGMADRIILPVRNRRRAEKMYPGREAVMHIIDAADMERLDLPVEYVIHCACVTRSAEMLAHPVETADSIVLGTRAVLEFARRTRIRSMVYLSSMEVYGKTADIGRPRREEELGGVELTSVRSCYPLGKRMAEHYCRIYQQEYGVPVRIARLAQTFGRGVRPDDTRVFMQFAQAAHEGRDIILKTRGESMGNYCASTDAVEAIFTILNRGADGETYNVVNEASTMRVREMAELVAGQIARGRISVRIEPDASTAAYAPDTMLQMSGEKLRSLGWQPRLGLAEMYREVLNELERWEQANEGQRYNTCL